MFLPVTRSCGSLAGRFAKEDIVLKLKVFCLIKLLSGTTMPDDDDFDAYDPLTPFIDGCIKFAYVCGIALAIYAIWTSGRAVHRDTPVYTNDLASIHEDMNQLRIAVEKLVNAR